MNLTSQLHNFIDTLGISEASAYFGKAESTVKSWRKTGKYPIEVTQAYLDSLNNQQETQPEPAKDEPGFDVTTADPASLSERLNRIEQYIIKLDTYLTQLEQRTPQRQQTTFPGGNRPMIIDASMQDGNFHSFVRPDQGVPGVRLTSPAPQGVPVNTGPKDTSRSDLWLKPRPLRKA